MNAAKHRVINKLPGQLLKALKKQKSHETCISDKLEFSGKL